jgi:hypothetical protein
MSKNGVFYFQDTGDPQLDKWEKELAQGLVPDLEEGLSSEEKAKLRKERQQVKRARSSMPNVLGIDEDYTAQEFRAPQSKQYDSKFVQPGSSEEDALIRKKVENHVLGLGQQVPGMRDFMDEILGD